MKIGTEGGVRSAVAPRLWGRYVLGLGGAMSGGVDLAWRPVSSWQQVAPLDRLPADAVLALFLLAAAVELAGGVAILWPQSRSRTVRAGALALVAAYLVVTLLTLPGVLQQPAVFNSWGNLGEQLSRLAGAVIAVAMAQNDRAKALAAPLTRMAYWAFAACVVSFMGEQWAYFAPTVALAPKWLPPGQVSWAASTTAFFGLAAAALLSGRMALMAARLLTAMLVGFGLLVWAPILVAHPHVLTNWTEGAETLSIAGAAWVVADYLAARRSRPAPAAP